MHLEIISKVSKFKSIEICVFHRRDEYRRQKKLKNGELVLFPEICNVVLPVKISVDLNVFG
jgi:hypothetical protein